MKHLSPKIPKKDLFIIKDVSFVKYWLSGHSLRSEFIAKYRSKAIVLENVKILTYFFQH